jgi:CHAT domain-containing protein
LTLIAEHQASLGATDLRVGSTVHARRLLDLGLGLAIETGRPRDVLAWAERVRANALTVPAARPSGDDRLVRELAVLRRLRADLEECRRQLLDPTATAAEVRRHEALVRNLARIQPGRSARAAGFTVDRLHDRLGDHHQLVEYVEHDGVLSAIVVTQRRCRHVRLGAVHEVSVVLDSTFFALDRLARDGVSESSLAAAHASLVDSAERLDELLIRPLRVGDVPLTVVPTGALHRVPWGALASLTSCAVAVTPSARRWATVEVRQHGPTACAVVTGPGLRAVDDEALAVASHYPSIHLLSGQEATVAATIDVLEATDTAHIACHGSFRSDSPMFSSLLLADGPLTVYELEGLTTPPSIVVLPSCHAGRAVVGIGDELIGTASALLGIGVATVIAPITVVNDRATVGVMAVLHRHLSAGIEPVMALAMTRSEVTGGGDLAASAAAAAMLCLE